MDKHIFMTGASGFLGRNLLTMLAEEQPQSRFLVLCRSDTAAAQMRGVFEPYGEKRLEIVRGDMDRPGLGLGAEEAAAVADATDLWHVAASTSFDDRDRDAIIQTNVGGTQNILGLARGLTHLEHFYFVSTAYVAGNASGPIPEDEMPAPTGFRNTYEETKWIAEKAVRESGLPFTIFRPSIVMGDSQTYDSQGETRMMYGYLLGIYYAIRKECKRRQVDFVEGWRSGKLLELPLRLIGHNSTAKNFVCIDDVLRAIKAILRAPHAGRTFNLTSHQSLTLGQMGLATQEALGVTGLHCVGAHIDEPNAMERAARAFTRPFAPYTLNSDPVWTSANTDAALLPGERRMDMSGEVFGRLLRRFVEQDIMATEPMDAAVSGG